LHFENKLTMGLMCLERLQKDLTIPVPFGTFFYELADNTHTDP